MAAWKPAYLIHGDAHGRIAERRARLRTMAEAESGVEAVEVFEGDAATPEAVRAALNAMTFAMGRRFVIVDGAERWKDAEVEEHLTAVLNDVPPDTTVAFFAREDGRAKAPASLVGLVKKAGDVAVEATPKARDLPAWAIAEAERLGVRLERPAAQALVASVGERQQRLLRELEKLAIEYGPGATLGPEEVEAAARTAARATCSRSPRASKPASPRRRSRRRSAATPGRRTGASGKRAQPTPTAFAARSRRSPISRSRPAAAASSTTTLRRCGQ